MRILPGGVLCAAVLSLLATGCQNKVDDENHRLWRENRDLHTQNDLMRMRPPAMVERPMPPTTAPAPRVAEVAPTPEPTITGVPTEYNASQGTMTVNLASDVYFDAGQATIKSGVHSTLDRVAAALKKDYSGKQVRVEGHTDTDPIRVSKWKSNQELSEARASAVKKYLVDHGVNSGNITPMGYGESRPRGQDKAANRRVEIVVLVNGGGAQNMSNNSMNK